MSHSNHLLLVKLQRKLEVAAFLDLECLCNVIAALLKDLISPIQHSLKDQHLSLIDSDHISDFTNKIEKLLIQCPYVILARNMLAVMHFSTFYFSRSFIDIFVNHSENL